MNMEHWWNENENSRKPTYVLVAKLNPVPLRPSEIPPSSKNSGICPLPRQSLQVTISFQHSASVQLTDTARRMQWVVYLLPTMEGVRGFQEVHKREDGAQSKLPRVLSAMKWNMVIFIVTAWMAKRDVPALLPVLLSNMRNERGMSCINICHMLWNVWISRDPWNNTQDEWKVIPPL